MALQLRERSRVDEFANYEQQAPEREMYIRTVNTQQNYNGGYDYNAYQGYAQPQQEYQQPQYTGYFQTQASQYVSNGFSNVPQYGYGYEEYQYQQPVKMNQINQIHERSEWLKKAHKGNVGKRSVNKDMIKIVVTVMVIAITICSLLIANQFISVNHQAQAEEEVQNLDSQLLASVATEEGSYVSTNVTILPEYEYEQSTNWFDKFCDSLGLKLK